MSVHYHSMLCLGDSYTIGESVPLHEGFPYQTIQRLRKNGLHFHAPEIVAQTGWTSFELADHLINKQVNEQYDFVSLLVGVNNQYRGLPLVDFEVDFEFLLKKALHLANGEASHVMVLSIPDWSVTPFAFKKATYKTSTEIDAFNAVCEKVCKKNKCPFINITNLTREVQNDDSLLSTDQLHYSAKMYAYWAIELVDIIEKNVHH